MLLGFKTKLKLNNKQRTILAKHAGVARHAWNWGLSATRFILDHNKENPDSKIKFPSAIDLHKLLVKLVKPEYNWYYTVSKCAPQYALRDLRNAWDRCFKQLSNPPKLKKKGRHDSFTLDGIIKVKGDKCIQVPFIGTLRTYERLPQVPIKNVTISRQADSWFISFKIANVERPQNKIDCPVGVDLGLLSFAKLSTGETINAPRPFRVLQIKLAKLQWRNRNKKIGSNDWRKSQIKLARLHARIANIRKDFIHQFTTKLAKNHSEIVIEDLNVSGMLANSRLSKAIADSGFYETNRQLTYKTRLYGSKLVVADRWFPSSKLCACCGNKKSFLPLSERVYSCECGWVCDRDFNAAINLVRLVKSDFMPVDKKEPSPLVEAGSKQQVMGQLVLG